MVTVNVVVLAGTVAADPVTRRCTVERVSEPQRACRWVRWV